MAMPKTSLTKKRISLIVRQHYAPRKCLEDQHHHALAPCATTAWSPNAWHRARFAKATTKRTTLAVATDGLVPR